MTKKTPQRETNPFRNSDSNKRYYTYEYWLRRTFGRKVAKIPLDAGLSCPNADAGHPCIYCSGRGSGDCVPEGLSLREQYEAGRRSLSGKWNTDACIAYLQAHTNTYAPAGRLREIYEEVLSFDGLRGMNIATRADCLPPDVLSLLREVSRKTLLTVELGLQSSNDRTAGIISRGHTFAAFRAGFEALRASVPDCLICVHVIIGLPGETEAEIMQTARDVASLHPDQIKIHLLHVLKNTPLADMYESGEYVPLEQSEYVRLTSRFLTLIPEDTVIGRLTGDGLSEELLSPLWSVKKTCVINDIDKYLYEHNLYQGCALSAQGRL